MSVRGMFALAIAVLVVVSAVAVSSAGARPVAARPSSPGARGWINISAEPDYRFQPSTFENVPTNANITVTFTDDDVMQHSFNISSREGFVIPAGYTPTQMSALFAAYPPIFSLEVNYSGDVAVGTFHSNDTPGWYEFVCNVSGHFQNGMYGFIAFGENLPANLTVPQRVGVGGGTISPAEAAVGAAIVLAAAVVILLGLRHRATARTPRDPRARRGRRGPPPRHGPPVHGDVTLK